MNNLFYTCKDEKNIFLLCLSFFFILSCQPDSRPPPRECSSDLHALTEENTRVGVNFFVMSNDPSAIKTPSPPQGWITGSDSSRSFAVLCPKTDGEEHNFSRCHAELMLEDLNRAFASLECNRLSFYLNNFKVTYEPNYYDNPDPHASFDALLKSSYNPAGYLNFFSS